jgi:hypothetical protein
MIGGPFRSSGSSQAGSNVTIRFLNILISSGWHAFSISWRQYFFTVSLAGVSTFGPFFVLLVFWFLNKSFNH